VKPPPAAARREWLEALYTRWNHPRFVSPDPLELVRATSDPAEAEVVAWLAASLSYGRVASILASARGLLARMDGAPRRCLLESDPAQWPLRLRGFVHRWSGEADMLALWTGLRGMLHRHGSLQAAFRAGWSPDHPNVLPALAHWVRELGVVNSLVPDPERGAAKRLHMFLRWMIRSDAVDPGLWTGFSPAQLLMPLDVHSFRQCRALRLTRRKQPGLPAVLDITRAFARLRPDDPVRYDFALTRAGIRGETGKMIGMAFAPGFNALPPAPGRRRGSGQAPGGGDSER
jgi:uncharacterized protein (TIGR02757 family)